MMITNSHIKKVIDKFLADNPDYKPVEQQPTAEQV